MTSHPKNCYLNIHRHKNLKSYYKIPHHVILLHLAGQNCYLKYFHSGLKRWLYNSRGKHIMVRLWNSKKKENANRSSSETMNRDIFWRKYEARKHTRSLMVLWCLFIFVFEDITLPILTWNDNFNQALVHNWNTICYI